MKKFVSLLLVLGMCSIATADLVTISGVPAVVDTSAGDVRFTFDIVSNGLLTDSVLDVYTTTGSTLDITGAMNVIGSGDMDDDPVNRGYLADFVDITDVAQPVIWASTALPQLPVAHVGNLITGLGLTVADGYEGLITLSVLDETAGEVVGTVEFEAVIPEPITIALLGLGGLFLRRRK